MTVPVGAPGSGDRGVTQPEVLAQDLEGPVGNTVFLERSFQCSGDDVGIINGPGMPLLWRIVKASQSAVFKA